MVTPDRLPTPLEALKELESAASILSNFDQQKYYFRKQGDWSRVHERIRIARAVIAANTPKPKKAK